MQGPRSILLRWCALVLRRPALWFPLWFAGLIALGTPLLMLDAAVRPGVESLAFLDALFTAVSAACTTGLSVVPPQSLSPLAYAVIGVLIQGGGIGLVLFTAALIHQLHQRAAADGSAAIGTVDAGRVEADADDAASRFIHHARNAIVLILLIELIGAVLLMSMWREHGAAGADDTAAFTWVDRFGLSVFHAVSAFCNAGFTMQNDSLAAYRYSIPVHLMVTGLIIAGGLGAPVLTDLRDFLRARWRRLRGNGGEGGIAESRLSLHSRIALTTSACLYLAGVVLIGAAQLASLLAPAGNESIAGAVIEPARWTTGDAARTLADASFLSITCRTGGFTTAPMDELAPASRAALMALMVIGASPGGTGGGLKTTTFAVIVLTIASTLRRHRNVPSLGSHRGDVLVRQSLALAGVFLSIIALATLLLAFTEPFPFERLLFEAISAASNTGLTLGITPDLSSLGKGIVAAAMAAGALAPMMTMGAMIPGPLAVPSADAHQRIVMA